jgi:hypothetical protein
MPLYQRVSRSALTTGRRPRVTHFVLVRYAAPCRNLRFYACSRAEHRTRIVFCKLLNRGQLSSLALHVRNAEVGSSSLLPSTSFRSRSRAEAARQSLGEGGPPLATRATAGKPDFLAKEAASAASFCCTALSTFCGQVERVQRRDGALERPMRVALEHGSRVRSWLSPRFARSGSRTCCGSGQACSDDGLSLWCSSWRRRQPRARAIPCGRSRTLPNSRFSAHGWSSRHSSGTGCSL